MYSLFQLYSHPDTHAVEVMENVDERMDKNTQTNNNKKGTLNSRIRTLENRLKEIYEDPYPEFAGDQCMKAMLERELGILREFRRDMYNCEKAFYDSLLERGADNPVV